MPLGHNAPSHNPQVITPLGHNPLGHNTHVLTP